MCRRPVPHSTGVLASPFMPLSLSLPQGSAWKGAVWVLYLSSEHCLLHGAAEEPDCELQIVLEWVTSC